MGRLGIQILCHGFFIPNTHSGIKKDSFFSHICMLPDTVYYYGYCAFGYLNYLALAYIFLYYFFNFILFISFAFYINSGSDNY